MSSDRFCVIPANRLPLPAKCWCCGSSSRPCVDWGADIAFQGAVLLCITCLAEAATLLETPVDHEKDLLKKQVNTYERVIGEFRAALDSALTDANAAVQFARMGNVSGDAAANESLAKAGR